MHKYTTVPYSLIQLVNEPPGVVASADPGAMRPLARRLVAPRRDTMLRFLAPGDGVLLTEVDSGNGLRIDSRLCDTIVRPSDVFQVVGRCERSEAFPIPIDRMLAEPPLLVPATVYRTGTAQSGLMSFMIHGMPPGQSAVELHAVVAFPAGVTNPVLDMQLWLCNQVFNGQLRVDTQTSESFIPGQPRSATAVFTIGNTDPAVTDESGIRRPLLSPIHAMSQPATLQLSRKTPDAGDFAILSLHFHWHRVDEIPMPV